MRKAALSSAVRRGFFFSYDALVAGVIFVLFLAIVFTYWTAMRAVLFPRTDEMLHVALAMSEVLLSPGSPPDWTRENWAQIGLVDVPRSVRINATKLENFFFLAGHPDEYSRLRRELAAGYEFFVSIGAAQTGNSPPPYREVEKVSITRAVIHLNKSVNMTITIWARVRREGTDGGWS